MDGAKESGDDETAAQGKAKEPPSPTENDAAAQGPAKEPPSTTEDEENDEAPEHAQESDAATEKLRASLESAIEAGEPVFLPSGSTYAAFPLETYLGYGLMNQCDGGSCRISLPRPGGGDARVFDGAASSQRHVSMPLATFLAVAVARDADADPDAAAVARTVPGFDDADAHDDLYACQLAPVCKSNLQPDFNMSVFECFDTSTSAVLRELAESSRFVQKSAESTSI